MLKLANNPRERRIVYLGCLLASLVIAGCYLAFLCRLGSDSSTHFLFIGVLTVLTFLCGVVVGARYAQVYAALVVLFTVPWLVSKRLILAWDYLFMGLLFVLAVVFTVRLIRYEERLLYKLDLDVEEFTKKTNASEKVLAELEKRAMAGDVKLDSYAQMVTLGDQINSLENMESLEHLLSFILREIVATMRKDVVMASICLYPHVEQEGRRLSRAFGLSREKESQLRKADQIESWIRQNKRPLIISDQQKDLRFPGKSRGSFRSTIAVPLTTTAQRQERTETELIGIIRLDSPQADAFAVDELRNLSNISDLCSATIVNTYLYLATAHQATTDLLTGLYVHRYFRERLDDELIRARKKKLPLAFMMCDIDHFKGCNDRFGHFVGDRVLKLVAQELLGATRNVDFVARYGGEEFAVILPETKKRGLMIVAERIRSRIEKIQMKVVDEDVAVTISIGCASFPGDAKNSEELIGAADAALYRAKAGGRNQVRFCDKDK